MEAVCSQATVPLVNYSFAGFRQSNSVQTTFLEGGLRGVVVRQSIKCKQGAFQTKHLNRIKRGGQLWGFELSSEDPEGFEDSIPGQKNIHLAKKSREIVANGVHRGNLNGYSTAEDADSGDKVHTDMANEVRHALTADASCAVVNSVNGGSRNGSANGSTVARAARHGSANGNAYNGAPPLSGSPKASIANGTSVYAGQENSVNTVGGIYRNARPLNGVSGNGAVNGYSKVPTADGSSTIVPELERLVQAPLNVPSKQSDVEALMELMHQLEDPLAFATATMTPLNLQSKVPVVDIPGQDKHSEKPNADGGLGILKFLKGKNLFVTGATGFLAKVMVEKILRVQPDVGQLYLLIQPQKKVTAEDRLQNNVIKSPLFKVLKATHGDDYETFMNKKLTAVSGTISTDGLGVSSDIAQGLSKIVDVIVNSAATTTFDERYDVAMNINTLGPRRILDFAHSCPNLQLFLHISTAFVNGQRKGRTSEKPFKMGDSIAREMSDDRVPELDVASELALCAKTMEDVVADMRQSSLSAEEQQQFVDKKMKELGMTRAKLFGWQDTYVFSKALGEMLLESLRSDMPVVVLRPSVVESTLAEPFPGWMEGIRMMDPIVLAYGKGQMTGFLANPEGVLDVIPADLVVNALLAAMTKHAKTPGLKVYQVASSVVNPMTFNVLADVALELFTKDPMVDRTGKPIKVKRMRFVQSMEAFNLYLWFVYQLPQQLSKILPWMKKKGKASSRFGIENTESLSKELSAEELEAFSFNVRQIDWAEYLYNVHIPGLRNYVLKGRGTRN